MALNAGTSDSVGAAALLPYHRALEVIGLAVEQR